METSEVVERNEIYYIDRIETEEAILTNNDEELTTEEEVEIDIEI